MKQIPERKIYACELSQLPALFGAVQQASYRIVGPKVKQGAIVLDFLDSLADLPRGYSDEQAAGAYRLKGDNLNSSYFGYAVGPHSLKNIFHPARRRLWKVQRQGEKGFTFAAEATPDLPIALFGIRPCDTQALGELDKVFLHGAVTDDAYRSLREGALILTATCHRPSALCFCTSMGHGPRAEAYDINLTEILDTDRHFFLVDAASSKGSRILQTLDLREASQAEILQEADTVKEAYASIKKSLETVRLPDFLRSNLDHSQWDDVAKRCLSCGNCTMVCPTCFCTTTEDITHLTGDHSERWLSWESCFTADFSYIHGGSVRRSTKSRYRHWLVHKLSTWHDQFGASGCVGCGRCIAWCPVGIDLTEEVKAMREQP